MYQKLSKTLFSFTLILTTALFAHTICAEPSNLGQLKKEVRQYYTSGQYEKEFSNVISEAQTYLLQQINDYQQHQPKAKLALVLDIDETSLSNYANIEQHDFAANSDIIHKEILEANAPALKPTLELYQTALSNGVHVFFVTGRHESELEATKTNLINIGYTQWDGLYVRPDDYQESSIIPFKSKMRARIEQQGYIILESIGDQYSDISGGHVQKGFKLPNPFYYLP